MLDIRRKRKMRIWDWVAIAGSLMVIIAYFIPWVKVEYYSMEAVNTITGWDMLLCLNAGQAAEYSYLGLVPSFVLVTALVALVFDIVSLFVSNERRDHIDAAIVLAFGILFLIIFMVYGVSLELFTTMSYERLNPTDVHVNGMFGAVLSLVSVFAAILGNVLNVLEDIVIEDKKTDEIE